MASREEHEQRMTDFTIADLPEQFGLRGLTAPEPGTGPDWANAEGPGRPFPPKSTTIRRWADIPSRQAPTDREQLAWLVGIAASADHLEAEWRSAVIGIEQIVTRATNGWHDGSLPELGHYRPVYFDGITAVRCPYVNEKEQQCFLGADHLSDHQGEVPATEPDEPEPEPRCVRCGAREGAPLHADPADLLFHQYRA